MQKKIHLINIMTNLLILSEIKDSILHNYHDQLVISKTLEDKNNNKGMDYYIPFNNIGIDIQVNDIPDKILIEVLNCSENEINTVFSTVYEIGNHQAVINKILLLIQFLLSLSILKPSWINITNFD
jgi:hypothetical protein